MKPVHHLIDARGIKLHVVEQGNGPLILFCHGFPATWLCWRSAMQAAADDGYRAVAFDMRGYGESDAPDDHLLYTPFDTVGDVIGILDHFEADQAVLVGHDFGATVAWNAAMMRPDRISADFCVSVPYLQPGGPSFLDRLRDQGKSDFYMFGQMKPEADIAWADASASIPSNYYWSSGEPPESERWDPFDPQKGLLRPDPKQPTTIDPEYIEDQISIFNKTGFHGALNYYRALDPFWTRASRLYAGARIRQPSFFLTGELDGLNMLTRPDANTLREGLPGLLGFELLKNVGHWPQLEAPARFNDVLVKFLNDVRPMR